MKRFWIILLSLIVTVSASAQKTISLIDAKLDGRTLVGAAAKPEVSSPAKGVVVVTVKIDPYGNVVEAVPGAEGTTLTDSNLWTASRNAAIKTHFNQKADAPAVQTGTISYIYTTFSDRKPASGGLKFMGISVDGTEEQMHIKLKEKGFTLNPKTGALSGQFNGRDVKVLIHTNHNLVDRIYVRFPSVNEYSIKADYNILQNQFRRNPKYLELSENEEIPEKEDISFEMSVHHKYYESTFYYSDPNRDGDEYVAMLMQKMSDSLSPEEYQVFQDLMLKGSEQTDVDTFTYLAEVFTQSEEGLELFLTFIEVMKECADGQVWFTIHEDGSKYHISLYYDNLHNRPHGEDL